jgi:hypothetical protein
VKDRGHLDSVAAYPVNDPVVGDDDLSDMFQIELRHDSSGAREVAQTSDRSGKAIHEKPGAKSGASAAM